MSQRAEPIKICWRATFQQPIGALNPMGIKVGGEIEVEVRQIGKQWHAVRPGTRGTSNFFPIAAQSMASILKRQVEGMLFEKRLTEWQAYCVSCMPEGNRTHPIEANQFALDDQEKAWRVKT